jgi:hypothetical protein
MAKRKRWGSRLVQLPLPLSGMPAVAQSQIVTKFQLGWSNSHPHPAGLLLLSNDVRHLWSLVVEFHNADRFLALLFRW